MLSEILFFNNLENPEQISYIQTENYTDENGNRRTREVIRTEASPFSYYEIFHNIKNYYYNINQRKNMSKITSFCIPKDMQIQEMDDFTMMSIPDFLSTDDNNFVVIYDSKGNESFNGFEGVGLNKKSLYQLYNRIILECKKEYTGAITTNRIKDLKKLYLLLGIGTSLNCGLSLDIANNIKDLIEKGEERVFYVSGKKLLNNIVTIENLIINTEYSTNMMGIQVNYVSGTHCNPDTQTNVYQDGYIIDYDSLKNLREVEECKNEDKNHIIIYDDTPDISSLFNISEEDYKKIFESEHNQNLEQTENNFSKIFIEINDYAMVLEYIFNTEGLYEEYENFLRDYDLLGNYDSVYINSEYENNIEFKNRVNTLHSELKIIFNRYIDEKEKDLEINNLERQERFKLFSSIHILLYHNLHTEEHIREEAAEILQNGISNYSTDQLKEFVNNSERESYLEENMSNNEDNEDEEYVAGGFGGQW